MIFCIFDNIPLKREGSLTICNNFDNTKNCAILSRVSFSMRSIRIFKLNSEHSSSPFAVGGESIPPDHAHHVYHVHLSNTSPSYPYSRTMCARHYGHAVHILCYLVRVRHYSYIQYTFERLHVRICCMFRNLFRQTDIYTRLSLSGCFRRSELLGCMTLPLPLSQDKVNITSGYLFETLDRGMFALDSRRKYITLRYI